MFTWVARDSQAKPPTESRGSTSTVHDPIYVKVKPTSSTTTKTVRKLDPLTPTQDSQRPEIAHASATPAVAIGDLSEIFEKSSVMGNV